MSTPRHLFKISHRNYIVRKFVESWEHGAVYWDEMLLDLAIFLEKRCNNLVDENGMRSQILTNQITNSPFPVLESSLVPDLSGLKDPLERQSKLISAIVEIEYIYQNLFKSVERKLNLSTSSPTFIRAIAPMESEILNEISKLPQNILDEVGEITSENLNYLTNASENFLNKTAIPEDSSEEGNAVYEIALDIYQQLENDKIQ